MKLGPIMMDVSCFKLSEIEKNQLDIIYDDRKVSLGNKFKDWELIGLNNIIIIGKNESINKTVTYKNRKNETKEEMSIENMVNVVRG